jgi:hypothetical protein
MELAGTIAGLRPGTPDNLPIVGRGAIEGLVYATGHFRNGILLAPLTADAVAATLAGAEPPAAMALADPQRSSLVRNTSPDDERTAADPQRSSLRRNRPPSDERTGADHPVGAPR